MAAGLSFVVAEEVQMAVRTRRLLILFALYLLGALLVGAVTLLALREAERLAITELTARGIPEEMRAELMREMVTTGLDQIAEMFGSDPNDFHRAFRNSMPVAVFFFMATTFLPLAVLAGSFDLFSSDLRARTFCFATMRFRRRDILLGRVIAQTVALTAGNAIAATAFIVLLTSQLQAFDARSAVEGIAWTTLLLSTMTFAYVGIATWASTATRRPGVAFLLGGVVYLGLLFFRIVGSIGPELDAPWSTLEYVGWLAPSGWTTWLWSSDLAEVGGCLAFYLAFGGAFVALGLRRFTREDL